MNSIRLEKLKEYIEKRSVTSIKELQEIVPEVSFMTLHRDLNALEKQGIIIKQRGCVKSVNHSEDVAFNIRLNENNQGKFVVARKALSLIQVYNSLFLDAGTSNLFMAKNMPDINLNIVTTGPGIALELCKLHNPVVTMCSGTMNRKNLAVSGQNTLEMLEKINIDTAFIGVSGCSLETGFTCGTEVDMMIKKLVIKKARVSVMMCSQEKVGRMMPYTFANFSDVDYIITDSPMPQNFQKAAKSAGCKIL